MYNRERPPSADASPPSAPAAAFHTRAGAVLPLANNTGRCLHDIKDLEWSGQSGRSSNRASRRPACEGGFWTHENSFRFWGASVRTLAYQDAIEDPCPYVLLNLFLSMLAAIQAQSS